LRDLIDMSIKINSKIEIVIVTVLIWNM
jgi:hypothetical protein